MRLRARLRIEDAVRETAALALGLERRALLEPDELEQRRVQLAELRARVVPAGLELETLPRLVRSLGALVASLRAPALRSRARSSCGPSSARARASRWLLDRLACVERPDAWSRIGAASIALDMTRVLCALCERELAGDCPDRGSRRGGARRADRRDRANLRRRSKPAHAASRRCSCCRSDIRACARVRRGEMPERLNGAVSKTVVP